MEPVDDDANVRMLMEGDDHHFVSIYSPSKGMNSASHKMTVTFTRSIRKVVLHRVRTGHERTE
jgi:hypothetical protein